METQKIGWLVLMAILDQSIIEGRWTVYHFRMKGHPCFVVKECRPFVPLNRYDFQIPDAVNQCHKIKGHVNKN
jgi:hypothetical protein